MSEISHISQKETSPDDEVSFAPPEASTIEQRIDNYKKRFPSGILVKTGDGDKKKIESGWHISDSRVSKDVDSEGNVYEIKLNDDQVMAVSPDGMDTMILDVRALSPVVVGKLEADYKKQAIEDAENSVEQALESDEEDNDVLGSPHAKAIIERDIAQLKDGNGKTFTGSLNENPGTQSVEEVEDPESQYKRQLGALMHSAETFRAALLNGIVEEEPLSPALMSDLRKLGDIYRDVMNARDAEKVWQESVAPEVQKLKSNDTEVMVETLLQAQSTIDKITQDLHGQYSSVTLGNADPSMVKRVMEDATYTLRGGIIPDQENYKNALQNLRGFDFTIFDQLDRAQRYRRREDLTDDDINNIYMTLHAQGGQFDISVARSRILAEHPERDTWRQKIPLVDEIRTFGERIQSADLNEKDRMQLIDEINNVLVMLTSPFKNDAELSHAIYQAELISDGIYHRIRDIVAYSRNIQEHVHTL